MFKCAVYSWILFLFVAQLGFPLIYACEDGFFGKKCNMKCYCANKKEQCNLITGGCITGCAETFTGEGCQEKTCKPGYFGENCKKKCNCANKKDQCNAIDGECTSGKKKGCEIGWFGKKCQYQCHCSNNSCDPDGLCENETKCVPGWFGPACQYVDLASSEHVLKGGKVLSKITDGDESTCLSGSLSDVTVTWNTSFFFTWLRIHTKTSKSTKSLTVNFKEDNKSRSTPCKNRRDIRVSDTVMDVYCDVTKTTKQVILTGKGVKSLCSLYISGGRNVALKGKTKLSSTYVDKNFSFVASNAVNGDKSGEFRKDQCASTAEGTDTHPNLNLTFKTPVTVNRIVLYNVKSGSRTVLKRLKAFILRGFSADNDELFHFQDEDKDPDPRHWYIVHPDKPHSEVSLINVEATNSVRILLLCELEVYGDLVCPDGKFGLGCKRRCHCDDKSEQCVVSTGGCVSGCAGGYTGEGCQDKTRERDR